MGCSLFVSCETISVSATAIAIAYVNPSMSVETSNDVVEGTNVLFYGSVYSFDDAPSSERVQITTVPVVGAQIIIVSTDSPGGYTFTDDEGNFEILLPIVPNQNGEVLSFAIEVQKEGAVTYPLSEICKDVAGYRLLGVSNPQEYYVASVLYNSFGWDIVGKKVKCTFPISMKL